MFNDENTLEDILSSIAFLQGYPNFWDAQARDVYPTLPGALREVRQRIEHQLEHTKNPVKHSWFSIALEMATEAERLYLTGRTEEGCSLLFKTADQLKEGNKAHRRKAAFQIDSDGSVIKL